MSGGTRPPPGRMRWGARDGAENSLFGARDQPRAPPTMYSHLPESEKPKRNHMSVRRVAIGNNLPPPEARSEPDVDTTRCKCTSKRKARAKTKMPTVILRHSQHVVVAGKRRPKEKQVSIRRGTCCTSKREQKKVSERQVTPPHTKPRR